MNVTREAIEELSLSEVAKLLHCHPRVVRAAYERGEIPGAYRTDGGAKGKQQYRFPLWVVQRWQAARGGIELAQ